MADISTINVNGTGYTVIDQTARSNAQGAQNGAEYARQESTDTYAGQSLASLFQAEISEYSDAWAWLRARVRAGNFAGIRIRDYLDVSLTNGNNVRYLVGAIDPYYQCGDTSKGHHVAMVPSAPVAVTDEEWQTTDGQYIYWNNPATNQGTADEYHPYLCSNLHEWETDVFYQQLPQAVRNAILNQRVLLEERYSSSGSLTASNSWSWADLGPIWSLSETEVYGTCVWGTPGYSVGFDCQFPIFRQTRDRVNGSRIHWWLRSVSGSSASYCCYVNSYGRANYYLAARTWVRPRPCFLVG